jgi:hypothetical protein
MASRLTEVIFDCHNLQLMSDFWCEALDYERVHSGDGWIAIGACGPELTEAMLVESAQSPALAFVLVADDKVFKNRVHIDVTPIDRSQEDEVSRLVSLGAKRIDIGQSGTSWVVMADPEGNEFCVMESFIQ